MFRVNIFSHAECIAGGGYIGGHINDLASFCAGYMDGGKDACTHDSGGPLICLNDQNEPVLQGLVSWGVRCALEKYPGIYTRVGSYLDWISENVTGKFHIKIDYFKRLIPYYFCTFETSSKENPWRHKTHL